MEAFSIPPHKKSTRDEGRYGEFLHRVWRNSSIPMEQKLHTLQILLIIRIMIFFLNIRLRPQQGPSSQRSQAYKSQQIRSHLWLLNRGQNRKQEQANRGQTGVRPDIRTLRCQDDCRQRNRNRGQA